MTELKLNDKYIVLSGAKIIVNDLAQELYISKDVQILLTGTVTKVYDEDLQDGYYDKVYIVKGIEAYSINGEETGD